jgi:RNA 3'-terminal phosphate cyclase (ATP)
MIEVESEHLTELFTGFGEKGVRAERVADGVARTAKRYLDANVPVGEHLADQLLIPLALAGAGSFRTQPLTSHSETNRYVIERFLGHRLDFVDLPDRSVLVRATGEGSPAVPAGWLTV